MKKFSRFAFVFLLSFFSSCANKGTGEVLLIREQKTAMLSEKNQKCTIMTVEIWSDFVCPFCYIGKRKFENALQKFEYRDSVRIVWKSYQLSPNQVTQVDKNAIQSLSESKGISFQEARNLVQYVTDMAKTVGLNYDFEKMPTVNTANAHRFSHLAKTIGKQDVAEELLFEAYFLKGENIDDLTILQEIGKLIGLDPARVTAALMSGEFRTEVERDIDESRQLGVRGVPFFLINNKYAISGAQDSDVFLKILRKAYAEVKP
jgi:predicted DsbA family dithiol-disulfide isomerase